MRKSPEAGTQYNRQRSAERRAGELLPHVSGIAEREPLGIAPLAQRLIRIENSSYPHSPAHNVMDFSFVDATYTATAGARTLTPTDRGTDGVVLNLTGQEIPDQTILMAWAYPRDPRWYTKWGGDDQERQQNFWAAHNIAQSVAASTNEPITFSRDTDFIAGGVAPATRGDFWSWNEADSELTIEKDVELWCEVKINVRRVITIDSVDGLIDYYTVLAKNGEMGSYVPLSRGVDSFRFISGDSAGEIRTLAYGFPLTLEEDDTLQWWIGNEGTIDALEVQDDTGAPGSGAVWSLTER